MIPPPEQMLIMARRYRGLSQLASKLTEWRAGFKRGATEVVENLLKKLRSEFSELSTEEQAQYGREGVQAYISDHITWLVGDEDDGMKRPMYWGSVVNGIRKVRCHCSKCG